MDSTETPDHARALAAIPSGLFIVTCGVGEQATGFLASFVQQVGFEPPVVTVAVGKDRASLDVLRETGRFVVSVLDEQSKNLLGHFARGFDPGENAFEGLDVVLDDASVPAPAGALARMSCRIVGESTWTDHVVIAGEVLDGSRRDDAPPMVHLRKNGLSY